MKANYFSDGLQALGSGGLSSLSDDRTLRHGQQPIDQHPRRPGHPHFQFCAPHGRSDVLIQGRIYPITFPSTPRPATGPFLYTINPDQLSYAAWQPNVKVTNARKARVTTVNVPNDTIDINNASQLYTNALVELDDGSVKQFATVYSVNDVSVTFQSLHPALVHLFRGSQGPRPRSLRERGPECTRRLGGARRSRSRTCG